MFSLSGKGQENVGDVIGAAIEYSGNYKLRTVTDDTEYHYFFAGINEENSEYHLRKGETFKTPALALTYSKEGLSGASRNFHKWGRKYILAHGNQERDILLNSWEGVYFGINQQRMDQMMADQSHMYIAYHEGFAKVIDRIRAKYKDVVIQCCASGGGRANWGFLRGFDELWVSDNTDALQRIYMQYGTSYFFPAIAMASHISAVPNHTMFRTTSLKYRIDVAMSGRLGMEIQPKNMTDEEKAICKKAISEYKEIRPIVQFGDLYRLVSPFDNQGLSSIMYVSEAKDKAVFYWWKIANFHNVHLPRVKMAGLDANKMYKVRELNAIDNKPLYCEGKSYSGRYLMDQGLEIPYIHSVSVNRDKKSDWSSRVICLDAE